MNDPESELPELRKIQFVLIVSLHLAGFVAAYIYSVSTIMLIIGALSLLTNIALWCLLCNSLKICKELIGMIEPTNKRKATE